MADALSPSDSLNLAPSLVPECVAGVRVAISHTFALDQYDYLVRTANAEKTKLGDLLSEILTDAIHEFIQSATNERADRVRIKARIRRTAGKKDAPATEAPKALAPGAPAPPHANLGELFDECAAKGLAGDALLLEVVAQAKVPLPIVKVLYAKHLAAKPAAPAPAPAMALAPAKPTSKAKPAKKAAAKKKATPKAKAAPKKATPKPAPKKKAKPSAKKEVAAPHKAKKTPSAPRPVTRTPRPKKKS